MAVLAIYVSIGFPQTIGGALFRGDTLNWQITVLYCARQMTPPGTRPCLLYGDLQILSQFSSIMEQS